MKQSNIMFQYKGARTYIQGPDIFNEMIASFSREASNIRFSVHGFIEDADCVLYTSEHKHEIDEVEGLLARCNLDAGEERCWMGLKPSGRKGQGERYAYDEDELIQLCVVDEEKIQLQETSPFTFIETVVAMNKHLLQKLFPDVDGKWVFTRIDLPKRSEVNANLSLQFKHNMNFRLLKSDIMVGDSKIGDLYFSLVKA